MLGGVGLAVILGTGAPETPDVTDPPRSPTVAPVPPPPAGLTFRDFAFDPEVVRSATAAQAGSTTWFADGTWWAVMVAPASDRRDIFRLDPATQRWTDTGVLIDERPTAAPDVLATEEALVVVTAGHRDSERDSVRLLVFDLVDGGYVLRPNFPLTIAPTGTLAATVAVDGTGRLWVTYTAAERVWVAHSLDHPAHWSAPFELPAAGPVTADDIASIVAFGPGRVGVLWTDQATGDASFAWHADDDPPTTWSAPEVVGQDVDIAADRIDAKAYPTDAGTGVVAALRTTADEGEDTNSLDPLVILAVRADDEGWATHQFGRVRDHHGRAVVMVDTANAAFAVAATSPGTGTITWKRTPMDTIAFDTGEGTALVASPDDPRIRDATSTKAPLTEATGMLVLAGDADVGRYLHAVVDLGAGLPDADPADPARLGDPPPPDPAPPLVLASNDFAPWEPGPADGTGWTVADGDPPEAMTIAEDGADRVLRLTPAPQASVRACRSFAEVAAPVRVDVRVRVAGIGTSDASLVQVRGSGGEAASVRISAQGDIAWFDGATKQRSLAVFTPGEWYGVTVTVDQAKRTSAFTLRDADGDTVLEQTGLAWREAAVSGVRLVCFETTTGAPDLTIDLSTLRVTASAG